MGVDRFAIVFIGRPSRQYSPGETVNAKVDAVVTTAEDIIFEIPVRIWGRAKVAWRLKKVEHSGDDVFFEKTLTLQGKSNVKGIEEGPYDCTFSFEIPSTPMAWSCHRPEILVVEYRIEAVLLPPACPEPLTERVILMVVPPKSLDIPPEVPLARTQVRKFHVPHCCVKQKELNTLDVQVSIEPVVFCPGQMFTYRLGVHNGSPRGVRYFVIELWVVFTLWAIDSVEEKDRPKVSSLCLLRERTKKGCRSGGGIEPIDGKFKVPVELPSQPWCKTICPQFHVKVIPVLSWRCRQSEEYAIQMPVYMANCPSDILTMPPPAEEPCLLPTPQITSSKN